MSLNQSPAFNEYVTAMRTICTMAERNEPAEAIAAYVLDLGINAPVGVAMGVSHAIENAAEPGSLAEAVFNILAN